MLEPIKKIQESLKVGHTSGMGLFVRKDKQPAEKTGSNFGFHPAPKSVVSRIEISKQQPVVSNQLKDKSLKLFSELENDVKSAKSSGDIVVGLCKFALNIMKAGVSALLGVNKNQSQIKVVFSFGEIRVIPVSDKVIAKLELAINMANSMFGCKSDVDAVNLLRSVHSIMSARAYTQMHGSELLEVLKEFSNMKFPELPKPDAAVHTNFMQQKIRRPQTERKSQFYHTENNSADSSGMFRTNGSSTAPRAQRKQTEHKFKPFNGAETKSTSTTKPKRPEPKFPSYAKPQQPSYKPHDMPKSEHREEPKEEALPSRAKSMKSDDLSFKTEKGRQTFERVRTGFANAKTVEEKRNVYKAEMRKVHTDKNTDAEASSDYEQIARYLNSNKPE